jgi:hypothetical protein
MRRSDRAARLAALQAEVAVLRATVTDLRGELQATREAAAVAAQEHAVALTAALLPADPPSGLQWLSMDLPVVAPPEKVEAAAADQPLPEAALLDPKQDRDDPSIDLTDQPSIDLTDDAEDTRRIA